MRKSGYYRACYKEEWMIVYFTKVTDKFFMIGDQDSYNDFDFDKDPVTGGPMIDETMINPEPQ